MTGHEVVKRKVDGTYTNWSQLVPCIIQRSAFDSPNVTRPLGNDSAKNLQRGRKRFGGGDTLASDSPGSGKSAIAQTITERRKQNIAECCEQKVRLGAAFFFFRNSSERSTSARLVATLAFVVTLFVPGGKEFITKPITDDPAIFKKHKNSLLLHLIVPLLWLLGNGIRCSSS